MIKTILIPITGGQGEDGVFETALAVARPLRSHLQFYRVRFSAVTAAIQSPHAGFCMGRATSEMLKSIAERDRDLSIAADRHFCGFCQRHDIPESAAPPSREQLCFSAQLTHEPERGEPGLLLRSRCSDLTVLSRAAPEGVSQANLIELLLLGSGHPVLVTPEAPHGRGFETIVVGWQDTAATTRSLSAAIPLLQLARKVHLVTLVESPDASAAAIAQVKDQLRWHGVCADILSVVCARRHVSDKLLHIVAELKGDLLVAGAFDHRPILESLFGGLTHSLLQHGDYPLFLMH
jgi:nucleotide-binding universal stress UspA family protein